MNTNAPAALPLMMGLPDDQRISVGAAPGGGLSYNFLGNARIGTYLAPRFKQRLVRVFFGPNVPIRIPPRLRDAAIVNAVGDADISAESLGILDRYLQEHPAACFNHPAAVLAASRDGVAQKLANIPGVLMPRTIRLRIGEPADLVQAAREHDLRWPLIVRVAGSHRGQATAKADDPAQLRAALRDMPWGGRDLYLTEYVECRDEDGHYRKMRIVLVGREIFIRHLVIANGWLVHVGDRELGHIREEEEALRTFRERLLPLIGERVGAIGDALDMDYFGIDCNLRPDGELLIFEANPLMDILHNQMTSPNCWDAAIAQIHDALAALLFDPSRWRHPVRETAAA
jgi:glutathione synthase/RimK-type ligase-like ATP-grasp enzyme